MTLPPFSVFLEEHRALVHRYLRVAVGPVDADDCFQETFLSALRAYPRLREGSNLRAWVMAIATRKAIDHARGVKRRAVPVADVPERAAVVEEDHSEVWEALGELTPRERAAVVQRYVLDLPYSEVGTALGSSEDAARAMTYEARNKLRRVIDAAGGKGIRVGGAEVSDVHANFIVTDAGATARDVWTLIVRLRKLVQDAAGVDLEPEVRFLGSFG
jgi:RNA polymerase sigma factor (sigma-70 family)